jgi:hypothetical protein
MKKVTEAWIEAAADDLRVIEKIAMDEQLPHMSKACLRENGQ